MTQFRLLGPVEIEAAEPVDLGPAKQQLVLAALAVDAGMPVSVPTLVERVWGSEPPTQARNALYAYVARLRSALRELNGAAEIQRRGGGYQLAVERRWVDLHLQRELVGEAARTADVARRADVLERALGLWRGVPLSGLAGDWVDSVRKGLAQERVEAAVLWAQARLALGGGAEVVSGVRALAEQHPLVEPLAEVLIRGLSAAGRAPEALLSFERTRRLLREELGADPGQQLRAIHRELLTRTASQTGPLRLPSPRPVPAQLPMDVRGFTGREDELTALHRLLQADGSRPAGVVLSAVAGTAGVGKTALAVHWAHRVAADFTDGQLYVDLRGYGPDPAIEPDEALAGFLRALGLRPEDVPLGLEERAARYRTEMAGRRMLVLLDNASSAEQVRPLLPGTASCAVLVTSRDSLAGLVVRDGAHRLDLDLLPQPDAVGLLRGLIGLRVDAEPQAAGRLALLCARLPLALRVAAELAAARPHTSLAALVAELQADHGTEDRSDPKDQFDQLDLLDLERLDGRGDSRSAVRAVFSWSYRHLDAAAARAFRLIGLHPGKDWDSGAAAALAGEGPVSIRPLLDCLARAHLLRPIGPDRFAMHDLLRSYAVWLTAREPGQERAAAIGRLCDLYLHTAIIAMDRLHPAELRLVSGVPHDPAVGLPALTGDVDSLAWLDAERANLVALAGFAAREGQRQVVVDLAATVFRYLDSGGHVAEALLVHTQARAAARALDQPAGEAHAVKNLAGVHWRRGDLDQAERYVGEAVALARAAGDTELEAMILNNLGILCRNRGDYQAALGHHDRAMKIFAALDEPTRYARALSEAALCRIQLGRYPEAAADLDRAVALSRSSAHRHFESCALDSLAVLLIRQGRIGEAAERLEQALEIATEIGTLPDQALFLVHIGAVRVRNADPARALEVLDRALTIARSTGYRSAQAEALMHRGEAQRDLGRSGAALVDLEHALALAAEIGEADLSAPVRNTLGETLSALGRPDEAAAQHREALGLAARMGNPYELGRSHLGLAKALAGSPEAGRQCAAGRALFEQLGVPAPN